MKNLIKRILKEEVNKKPDSVRYWVVFVSGIESTWGYETQRSSFDKSYSYNLPVKQFRYKGSSDWNKNVEDEFKKFLSENEIDSVILFSAGCYAANTAADIVGPENVYCIEPYKTSTKWTKVPAKNFYVNKTTENRGSIAKSGIPEENKNTFYGKDGHVESLTWAVSKIF